MEPKTAQNIQDTFLNTVRKDKSQVTVYLVSGVKLAGRIRSFDKYSVLLENNNQEQLIFKHAISTVVGSRSVFAGDFRHGGTHAPTHTVPSATASASGTAAATTTSRETSPASDV
jgi:host factor-I protein